MLLCRIRNEWVKKTPEELVRQRFLSSMIDSLGYPSSLVALEKGLWQFPHVSQEGQPIPKRRADIICFSKGIHPDHELYPLLLVECKAVALTPKVVTQVVGYNFYLKAHFVCIVNSQEARTGWYHSKLGNYVFYEGLPSFSRLHSLIDPHNKLAMTRKEII